MSRLSFTVLKHLPIGYWVIVVWCALLSIPFVLMAGRLDGHAEQAAILAALLQIGLSAGMLLRLRWVRLLLILYVAGSLFIGTMVVAVIGLLYVYVGLAHVESLIGALAGAYYLFMVWAYFYLFHPNLTDVFEWHWLQTVMEAQGRTTSVAHAA
jgi:hypothetical protein